MLKLDCRYKFDTEGLMSATKSASEFAKMLFLGNRQNSLSVAAEEGNKDFIFHYAAYISASSSTNRYGRRREM